MIFFFFALLDFSAWKPVCHRSTWSLFLECQGKSAAARERMGKDRKGKERAHPFLGHNSRAERSLGFNSVLLWNYVKLIFCLLVQWKPLAMALTWKAINKEIAYSIASVLISLFETWTHFLPLPWVVCVCMCRHLGRSVPCCCRAGQRTERFSCWCFCWWPFLAAQERCSSPQQGPTSRREGGVCSHTVPAYHIKPLSKVSLLKFLTALWFLLKVVGWKPPFQRDNHVQVQGCFCSVIPLNYHSWKRLEVVFRLKFKSARIRIEVKKYFL